MPLSHRCQLVRGVRALCMAAITAWLWAGLMMGAGAAVWHVDDDGAERPNADFSMIQPALDVARQGDEIVVWPGRYLEALQFRGRDVRLRSSDPLDPEVVAATQIDPQFIDSAIRMAGNETAACMIEGLTITHGLAEFGGGILGGTAVSSGVTVRNNVLRDNLAREEGGAIHGVRGTIEFNTFELNNSLVNGGALSNCNGLISANLFLENQAFEGGGLHRSTGTVRGNTFRGNSAEFRGGAIVRCSGLVEKNIIELNSSFEGGGLVFCSGVIAHNLIQGNVADKGGGLLSCRGRIENNQILKNTARRGAGIYASDTTIIGNLIKDNSSEDDGGGLDVCWDAVIEGNRIVGNVAGRDGGGLFDCRGTIRGNTIQSNRAIRGGGGLANCEGRIDGNRVEGNAAARGGGFDGCDAVIQNNLIQANRAQSGSGMDRTRGLIQSNTFAFNGDLSLELDGVSSPTTSGGIGLRPGSVVRDNIFHANQSVAMGASTLGTDGDRVQIENNCFWLNAGGLLRLGEARPIFGVSALNAAHDDITDNIAANPRFVDAEGPDGKPAATGDNDLRLTFASPCRDRGSLHVMARLPVRDVGALSRLVGAAPDLGCHEWNGATDTDGDGLADETERAVGADPELIDTDGDGASDAMELQRRASPSFADAPVGISAVPGGATLQELVLLAFQNETITLEPGIHDGSVWFGGKTVHLRGTRPTDVATVLATVIDGGGRGALIMLDGSQPFPITIEGLTLRHGRARAGAAILANKATMTLRYSLITSNTSTVQGSVDQAAGLIQENYFVGNMAELGGGMSRCSARVVGNTLLDNQADKGGGMSECTGDVIGNLFRGNRAESTGGAIDSPFGRIEACVFESNAAVQGGGVSRSTRPIVDCTFTSNTATEGGALHVCFDAIRDNHFEGNHARNGGALFGCNVEVIGNRIVNNVSDLSGAGIFSCDGPIRENHIEGNTGFSGTGLALCDGPIENNVIVNNSARADGGGLSVCGGRIRGNRIEENSAAEGGGLFRCAGVIEKNVVIGNTATVGGGGFNDCDGTIRNNLVRRNQGENGGGFRRCDALIENNRVELNTAVLSGGAFNSCNGTIRGNLIVGNRAEFGGAAQDGLGDFVNNTIAFNSVVAGGRGPALDNQFGHIVNNLFHENGEFAIVITEPIFRPRSIRNNAFHLHSRGLVLDDEGTVYGTAASLDDGTTTASANLDVDPRMVDPDGPDDFPLTPGDNDFALRADSPLIDAGLALENPPAADIANTPRVLPGPGVFIPAIDIGALEFLDPDPPMRTGLDGGMDTGDAVYGASPSCR